MEKTTTSVEWLVDKFKESGITLLKDELEFIKQAKQMEKEQVKVAYDIGWQDGRNWPHKHSFESPEQYYNEKFK